MVPGAILQAHVSPSRRRNPPLVKLHLASTRPVSPVVMWEAALSPHGAKDPPAGASESYRDVLPLPLANMFSGRVGRPLTIRGGEEPNMAGDKGGFQWERYPGSEASAKEEDYEEEDGEEFLADKAGKDAPGTGSGHIEQILESISALASSIALLKVQANRE